MRQRKSKIGTAPKSSNQVVQNAPDQQQRGASLTLYDHFPQRKDVLNGSTRYTMSSTESKQAAIDEQLRKRFLNGMTRDVGSSSQCYGAYQMVSRQQPGQPSKRKAFTSEGGSRPKRGQHPAAVNNIYRLRQALESQYCINDNEKFSTKSSVFGAAMET